LAGTTPSGWLHELQTRCGPNHRYVHCQFGRFGNLPHTNPAAPGRTLS